MRIEFIVFISAPSKPERAPRFELFFGFAFSRYALVTLVMMNFMFGEELRDSGTVSEFILEVSRYVRNQFGGAVHVGSFRGEPGHEHLLCGVGRHLPLVSSGMVGFLQDRTRGVFSANGCHANSVAAFQSPSL